MRQDDVKSVLKVVRERLNDLLRLLWDLKDFFGFKDLLRFLLGFIGQV